MDLLFDQLVESDKMMKAEAAEVSIEFVFLFTFRVFLMPCRDLAVIYILYECACWC